MAERKVHLNAALTWIEHAWRPRVVAQIDGYDVKLVKVRGDSRWYRADGGDALVLCLKGGVALRFRQGEIALTEGELYVVARGTEYRPVAHDEANVLVLESHGSSGWGPGEDAGG